MSKHQDTDGNPSPYASRPWLKNYDYWVPADINYPRQSIYQILQLATGRFGERPATAFFGAHLTFRELKDQVDRFATALVRLGIAKGDRVGIMLPNSPQYLISFFAIVRLGAIVTNINPIYTLREVDLVAQDAGLKAVITLDQLAPLLLAVKQNSTIEHVIATSVQEYTAKPEGAPSAPDGTLSLTGLIKEVEYPDLPRVDIDPEEDVAVLQYTGGTTGVPKGAMLTHYNLYANSLQSGLWGEGHDREGQ